MIAALAILTALSAGLTWLFILAIIARDKAVDGERATQAKYAEAMMELNAYRDREQNRLSVIHGVRQALDRLRP